MIYHFESFIFALTTLLINFVVNEANKEKCYKIILDCDANLEFFYKKSGLEKKGIQMAKYFT